MICLNVRAFGSVSHGVIYASVYFKRPPRLSNCIVIIWQDTLVEEEDKEEKKKRERERKKEEM